MMMPLRTDVRVTADIAPTKRYADTTSRWTTDETTSAHVPKGGARERSARRGDTTEEVVVPG